MGIKTRDVLVKLGFGEDWKAMTDELPAYQYSFDNLVLHAAQVTSLYLRPVFFLSGVFRTSRSISSIEFEMPTEVESFEQGVAFIAYAIGRDFIPVRPTPWLEQGRAWEEYLPWVREQREFEKRPRCYTDRDWFRVANKKLREIGERASDEEYVDFHFDGEVLKISEAGGKLLAAVQATGAPWAQPYRIPSNCLRRLPKRLMNPEIHVDVWKGQLRVANIVIGLTSLQVAS